MIRFLESKLTTPDYSLTPSSNHIILYHNTTGDNVDSILKNGLIASKGKELGRGRDGDFVWAEVRPNLKGYGGYTIAFEVPKEKLEDWMLVNDTQYTLPFDIPAEDILFVDRPVMDNIRESDIKGLVQKFGKEKVKDVFTRREYKIDKNFTLDQLLDIVDNITITEDLTEGIHLTAFVKKSDGQTATIEDNDYNSKTDFLRDLKANGYIVNSIKDNRDMYLLDNTEYRSLNDIEKRLRFYRRMKKDSNNAIWDKDIKELEDIIKKAKSIPLNESKLSIPKEYKDIVESFYKTATGEWCIDLKPGYSTSYGTNYILCKTKSECIHELKNFVSSDMIIEKKEKKSGLEKFKEKHGIETVGEGSIGFSEKEQKWYGWSHRAIYGFKIGDTVKEGDIVVDEGIKPGFECKTLEDCKKLAKAFSDAVA